MKKFFKFWLPVIMWMAIIFTLSSIPDLKTDLKEDFILRKIAHILEFAILTFLLFRAMSSGKSGQSRSALIGEIIYSAIIALFYAFSDEFHQFFVQGRQCSFRDVSIDSVGILIVASLCYIKNRKKLSTGP
jgi:VanZ family protein